MEVAMKKICFLLLTSFLLNSCAFYQHAKPIKPKVGWPRFLESVDSMHPTLSWEPYFEGPYDIIVYELIEVDDNGRVFYSADNLVGTSHKIQRELKPDMYYRWAVKKHSDTNEAWSRYNYFVFLGFGFSYFYDVLFGFKTPKEGAPERTGLND
jgi:hypothetical protein